MNCLCFDSVAHHAFPMLSDARATPVEIDQRILNLLS